MKNGGSKAAWHQWRNSLMLCLGDALVLALALWLGRYAAYVFQGGPLAVRWSLFIIPVWWTGAAAVGLLPSWGLGEVEELRRLEILLLVVFAAGGVVYFFIPQWFGPSRMAYLVSLLVAGLGLPFGRLLMKKVLLRAGAWGCPAVIYGPVDAAAAVIRTFQEKKLPGYFPVKVFTGDQGVGETVEGVPVAGGMNASDPSIPVALVCMNSARDLAIGHFDRTLAEYRQVLLLPMIGADFFQFAVPRTLGGLIGLQITSNLMNPVARLVKRTGDLTLTLLTAPLWVPLLGVVAGLIRMVDRHPVFFRQERMGRHDVPFRPFKFQTMVPEAEEVLAAALEADPQLGEEWVRTRKLSRDPRVTRLGAFLRRWSLDELPQLLNVLSGEMALVGPRPLPDYHHADLDETTRKLRAQVRPGMTGLWQVSGRSCTGTAGMDKWDSYYVRNWSVWLDMIILAKTVRSVFRGEGAY